MGQHALLLTLLLGTFLHSEFLQVGCLLFISVFFVGYFLQFVRWSVKEKLLFFGWESLLFGSHTAPKSCLYPEVLQEISGFISDNQDTLRFKNSRKGWCMSDPGLLPFWYCLWWSRMLEIAPKLAIWKRVRLTWRKPTPSLPSRCVAGSQGTSEAAPMTPSLVFNQLKKPKQHKARKSQQSSLLLVDLSLDLHLFSFPSYRK